MNVVGIIAEYNPFHKGHLYQIEKIRKQTKAKHIVVVMSGDYVQRGTPAWTDKYLRTTMALKGGVDMVLELPVSYAVSSAEFFARGGISILTSLGFADSICFGSEASDLSLLQKIASFLVNPPKEYDIALKQKISQGYSFPQARQQILDHYFSDEQTYESTLLSSPNNILAIEYLKALQYFHSPLQPLNLLRKGAGYHSTGLTADFTSATAIRKESFSNNDNFLENIKQFIPPVTYDTLKENQTHFPMSENYFSDLIYYSLIQNDFSVSADPDFSKELLCRVEKLLPEYRDFSTFVEQLKTKQYTHSRISRVLLRNLLISNSKHHSGNFYTTNMYGTAHSLPYIPYVRLLGFRKEASHLLRNTPSIPIITKPADGEKNIAEYYHNLDYKVSEAYITDAQSMYKNDLHASNLYSRIQTSYLHSTPRNEYKQKPIIL